MTQVPTNQSFADEVKIDRLKVLWRVTLVGSAVIGWIVLNIGVLQRVDVVGSVLPFIVLAAVALVTRWFVNHNRYTIGAWSYSLGTMLAVAVALMFGARSEMGVQIIPFSFSLVIFIVGLLMRPQDTIFFALVSTALIIGVPAWQLGSFEFFSLYQIAAIALTVLSALLGIQVTGDLFQITDWALSNYQRERRIAGELFESRAALEKSLLRAQALSDQLKLINEDLAAARTAAEEAKHYRGQFLANMSHELRTPLNAVIGFSETMLKFPAMYDGIKLPSAYEDDLSQIYSSGRQLLNLINDILDLAKVDAGKLDIRMERVDLRSVVSSVVSTAAGLIGAKPVRLEVEMPDPSPALWADRARVSQILLNIYSNAAKFTDEGSIRLRVNETDEGVLVSVTDTGMGIAQNNLELIFEEFKQAETGRRDPRSGAGLGLAISRQLATLMGGRIWADSELGKGSTFHVLFQAYRDQDQQSPDVPPQTVEADLAETAVAQTA
ncbi:HAMP domain-containing histidine kinase [Anaerolineae bacterium CFX9]|nr:HAMP domain-containing histidine kinase [Anaerolineae bacterium CFX9]